MDCYPTLCGMPVEVEGGRLPGIRGHEENPDSRGLPLPPRPRPAGGDRLSPAVAAPLNRLTSGQACIPDKAVDMFGVAPGQAAFDAMVEAAAA